MKLRIIESIDSDGTVYYQLEEEIHYSEWIIPTIEEWRTVRVSYDMDVAKRIAKRHQTPKVVWDGS